MGQRGLERIQTWNYEEDVRGLRQALAQTTRKDYRLMLSLNCNLAANCSPVMLLSNGR